MATNLPRKMPGTDCGPPAPPIVISHAACASRPGAGATAYGFSALSACCGCRGQRGDRGLVDRGTVGDRRVERPREAAVTADGRCVEARAQVHRGLGGTEIVQLRETKQRCCVPLARSVEDRRNLRRDTGIEVGVE